MLKNNIKDYLEITLKQHIHETLDKDEAIEEIENMDDGPEETEMDLDT